MPTISLAGCVILHKGALLLLHRSKKNWYELPGGKIDDEESAENAAKRELREEILCDVDIVRKLGTEGFEEDGMILVYTWFLAKIHEGQSPIIGEPETFDTFTYVPLKELSTYPLSPNMKNFVAALERNDIVL